MVQGVAGEDNEATACTPMRAVPRWGFKLIGKRALESELRESSVYELQKFQSRLLTAGRVLSLVARRLPGRADRAAIVADELEQEWAGLLHDAECSVRGVQLPPERMGRFTEAPPPPAAYATRTSVASGTAVGCVSRSVRAQLLLAMYHGRTITGATSHTFGHRDSFGSVIADALEDKMTIALRDGDAWTDGPRLYELEDLGPLPPGALGYARTKAATICRAGRDMEFHQLAHAVHLSGSTAAWLRSLDVRSAPQPSPTRGVWDADGWFRPWGVALCDWWADKSRREQRQWLRDHGRAVVRGPSGLYRYFSR